MTGPSRSLWPTGCGKEMWGAEKLVVPEGRKVRGHLGLRVCRPKTVPQTLLQMEKLWDGRKPFLTFGYEFLVLVKPNWS